MAMNETVDLVLVLEQALVAGLVLGMVFFGGLWWTLRKSLNVPAACAVDSG
jgi:F1F0 ATPase subunit 2